MGLCFFPCVNNNNPHPDSYSQQHFFFEKLKKFSLASYAYGSPVRCMGSHMHMGLLYTYGESQEPI